MREKVPEAQCTFPFFSFLFQDFSSLLKDNRAEDVEADSESKAESTAYTICGPGRRVKNSEGQSEDRLKFRLFQAPEVSQKI